MFKEACKTVRESLYGVMGTSVLSKVGDKVSMNFTNGTAFMVAPGYLVTAGHFIHQENNPTKPIHQTFEVIRATEIGQNVEKAIFIARDPIRDLAILKIENPKNSSVLSLKNEILSRGDNCGFLGFPLSVVMVKDGKKNFNLAERFQGAYISNYTPAPSLYEIDTLMYPGSSGCPGFNLEGEVIGMQVGSVMQKTKDNVQAERVAISTAIPSTEIIDFLKLQKIL